MDAAMGGVVESDSDKDGSDGDEDYIDEDQEEDPWLKLGFNGKKFERAVARTGTFNNNTLDIFE